jgi:hypothetical protein
MWRGALQRGVSPACVTYGGWAIGYGLRISPLVDQEKAG